MGGRPYRVLAADSSREAAAASTDTTFGVFNSRAEVNHARDPSRGSCHLVRLVAD